MATMAHMLPAFQKAPEMQPYKMTVLLARFGQSPFCKSVMIPVMMGAASRTPAPSAEQTSVTGAKCSSGLAGEACEPHAALAGMSRDSPSAKLGTKARPCAAGYANCIGASTSPATIGW